ncbi:histidine-rich glycoprotein-like [Anopheles maculipalpis]|uniref:histidine-rich glycoprotein-like n=1 Tax=Anopheles maculipalpis TaxID=1496333 RepID=UPI002159AFE2|nr:histidine-rich glycoprotein-like [Anopheles maculipalpis]
MLKLPKCACVLKHCCYILFVSVIMRVEAEAPINSYLPPAHGHGHGGEGGHHDDHHTDLVPPSSSYGTPDSSYGPPHHQSGFHPDHHEYEDHHDHHDNHDDSGSFEDEPAKYEFSYEVDDEDADLSFGHEEMRDGDYTTGKYNVLLPDGRRQIVEYEADHKGYRPKITYEGGDEHPHHHDHPHEHGHDHGHGGYSKETPHTQLGYPRESHHDFEHNGIAHGSNEYDSHGHDNGHSRADHGIHDGHRGYDSNAHDNHGNGHGHGHGHGHNGHNGHNGHHHNGHNGHHRRRSSNAYNHQHPSNHHSNDNHRHNGYH